MMAAQATRFCVSGTSGGREVEAGTAVVPGRDYDLMISYVCAKDPSMRGAFRAMTKGALTSFSRLGTANAKVEFEVHDRMKRVLG